ncbi:MAG TPA: DUF1572 family protein [Terracidiphilus sp.]|jgi:hypothetical protein
MAETEAQLATLFLNFSRNKLLGQYWPRLKETVAPLTEEQVWWRANESSNSIGNLILHLNGNMGQWLVASFNRREEARNRPQEFSERDGMSASALLEKLGATIEQASAVLARLTVEDLLASYAIQGYEAVRGLDAVYQVVEHFGLHYGQILYIAKSLTDRDLGFYKHLNQTGRA